MLIMIEKDAATKVSKEVAGMDEARGFASISLAKAIAAWKAAHPE